MFTLKDIEKITNGKIINGDGNTIINKYSTAKKTFNQGIFYVPIIFKKQNREEFILEAVKNGAIGFMINEDSINYEKIINEALKINPNIIIVAVSNVNVALFNLGLEARKLNITKEVIAITGSFGKSTLTNMIAKVLATEMKVLYDFNNGNNNTKSFLSRLLQEFDNYEIAVLELGTANPGRITDMSKLVKPSIAVINSIGTAHINNFLTKENILEEKMHIVDYLKDIGIGFLYFCMIPIVSVILMITVIGLPIGIFGLLLYFIAIYISIPITSIEISKLVLKENGTKVKSIFIALLIFVVFKIVKYIPIIGDIIRLLAILFGIRIIVKTILNKRPKKAEEIAQKE